MLSIIIPTLNEEKHLPLLFREIKKQNFNDYQTIVADADSKDKTIKIAEEFGAVIVKGGLPAKGRNEGAKVAKGDIFLFIDADNFFLPENFLKNILKIFQEKNLGSASFPIYPKGKKIDLIIYGIYNNFVNLTQIPYAFNSILVRRDIFEKVNGFDEKIKIGEDHCFVKRAAKFGKFGFIKTEPILTSARRFEKDGRFKTYSKYALAGLYMAFFGPVKKDIFKYRFGYNLLLKKEKICKKKKND